MYIVPDIDGGRAYSDLEGYPNIPPPPPPTKKRKNVEVQRIRTTFVSILEGKGYGEIGIHCLKASSFFRDKRTQ
jgi:hypothetical protein